MKVVIFKNCENAKNFAKQTRNVVAVEAEYGKENLELGDPGVLYEMNHHGEKQHFSAPCSRFEVFGVYPSADYVVSHLDLDTVMGIGIASGLIKDNLLNREFGRVAEFVDVYGLHRMDEIGFNMKEEIDNFQFFMQKENRVFQEGEDITNIVIHLINELNNILDNGYNKDIVNAFNQEKQDLVKTFEVKNLSNENIRVFKTNGESMIFEYDTRKIIVQLNKKFNTITLAVAKDSYAIAIFGEKGVVTPLKEFFGENSGGKITIGGGDKSVSVGEKELIDFVSFLKTKYSL